ncbi:molecular chaperone DnaK [Longispora fulva]|uniref:Molecular chaperone DnaK (HSP70) n=1 Tax=Longispora fulva TaxID=619741 RepID=A0A8J7GL55_9ACTN|nr:Hsp70 family protein [Longispora fulva]MBG6141639.1 molecular chaperone DnaK (HSP70) [Longispora fulva]GIG59206.1 molecular chaperone DnaK [Longispora fulva]
MTDETDVYCGIDLGTTYSAIAYVDETARPTMVRSLMESEETTPSVVYFESGSDVVVGRTAKEYARVYPDRVVSLVKRSMGQQRHWIVDDVEHTPESISALILKQLVQDARAHTGREVDKVVITVPAYFGMLERDATRKAGEIAGLDVIGIVPEPVAAALQYEVATGAERTVLVYDLGGGTFDTTVIRITSDAIEVLCTDGDQQLGGADWDARLVTYLLGEFTARAGVDADLAEDDQFMQELVNTAENAKKRLSQSRSAPIPLRAGGVPVTVELTREIFEEQTRDLLDRTIEYTKRTLVRLEEKSPGTKVDEVLLVGGSTKMPAVAERLRAEFGWEPRMHDPDLAVAKGAARFALSRSVWEWDGAEPTRELRQERIRSLAERTGLSERAIASVAEKRITNVLPKAFGVKLVDTTLPGWADDVEGSSYIGHMVHADEALPRTARLDISTVVPNQTEVLVELYEQAGSEESRDLAANKPVDQGSGLVSGLPPMPVGSPLDIAMTVDDEGLLTVTAVEPSTGKDLTIEVRVSVLSPAEVEQAKRTVAAITVRG